MAHKNCVLVIEADPVMRRRVCRLLEKLGCDTRSAPRRALHKSVPPAYDLVLCAWDDWVGSSVTHLPRSPRVVLLSRIPEESDWVQALKAGAFDLIEEPHSGGATREFRRVVASALCRAREARACANS